MHLAPAPTPDRGAWLRHFLFSIALLSGQPAVAASTESGGPVFLDGFESGSYCSWSDVVGAPPDGNDTEATAVALGTVSDCDALVEATGTLDGAGDVDFFVVTVSDDVCGSYDPDFLASTLGGARFCIYVECLGGGPPTDLTCLAGAIPAVSPDGRLGCCSTTGVSIDQIACAGGDDSTTNWIRLDASPSSCTPYTVSGHF